MDLEWLCNFEPDPYLILLWETIANSDTIEEKTFLEIKLKEHLEVLRLNL